MGFYAERVFPRLLAWATREYDDERRDLVGRARGRVLEIGIGDGASLPWYGKEVTEVVGIEPSPALVERARARIEASDDAIRAPVTLVPGSAEDLDFPDGSFDTVVTFLVMCSVPDPGRVAGELFRVLRPGGRLVVFEHVRARTRGLRVAQKLLNPLWRVVACGCNLDRATSRVLAGAGFRLDDVEEYVQPSAMRLTSPKLAGLAAKPEAAPGPTPRL